MAFEQNSSMLDKVSETNLFEWIYEMLREAHTLGAAPTLFAITSFIMRFIGPEDPTSKFKGNDIDKLIDRFMEHQEKSKSVGQSQRNLASRLLKVQAASKSEALTDKEFRLLLQVILIAGTTDAVTWINSIFYHLIHNPDKKAKLLQELREKRAKGQLGDVCTSQQAAACPYLNAVLQESLRLYPSNAGLLPRETPETGIELGGHHIPAGVTIGAPAYVIQRLPNIFGADTNSFLPERWLENPNTDMSMWLPQ
jgi:cytochrome P450